MTNWMSFFAGAAVTLASCAVWFQMCEWLGI